MADFRDNVTRGLETYVNTQSPALGVLDFAFGEDPGSPQDLNRNSTLDARGLSSTIGEQTTNSSQQQDATANVLSGSTALSDTTTANTGLQSQVGQTGIGAFTGQTGLGTSGYDPVTGQFTGQLANPYQQNVNQALGASSQGYGALLGQDFNGTMGQRYNALEALQEQDRLQAQMAMEDRLYSQGRLGSTGGALQQNALLDAIAQQQAGNANTAFGQAMAQRQQFGDQAMQFGQAALQPQQLSLQQLQAMGALAPQLSNNQIQTNNLSEFTGLQDTTGFQDSASSSLTNASSNTLSEQLAMEAARKAESIRSVDQDTPILSLTQSANPRTTNPAVKDSYDQTTQRVLSSLDGLYGNVRKEALGTR